MESVKRQREPDLQAKAKRGFKLPHVYVLLMIVMLIVVGLSWMVPSGEFALQQDPATGRMLIDPTAFSYTDDVKPITVMDYFTSIHQGIVQSGDIIFLLLFASGALYIVEASGAIGAGIHKILEVSEGKETIIIAVLTLIFATLGAIGFGEGGLPFIPLAVAVVTAMGYDKITGMATAMGGMAVGFASGVLNLYTTGISQMIVGLPIYSGIAFRSAALALFYVITLVYILRYAKKIKHDPSKSVLGDSFSRAGQTVSTDQAPDFTLRRKLALVCLGLVFILQAFGALKLKWGMAQISGLYLMFAAVSAVIINMNPSEAAVNFAKGVQRLIPAGLAIGLARSVMVLMNQSKIIDTAIYNLSAILEGEGALTVLALVYVAVIGFNFFVVSGSGKAVIMMPILGPLGQLMHINQQVMVLLYQYGDGFTNYIWPTSGGLMAALAMCDVEWQDWAKFSANLFIILSGVAFALVVMAHMINLGPF